jgi:hypothetical protein
MRLYSHPSAKGIHSPVLAGMISNVPRVYSAQCNGHIHPSAMGVPNPVPWVYLSKCHGYTQPSATSILSRVPWEYSPECHKYIYSAQFHRNIHRSATGISSPQVYSPKCHENTQPSAAEYSTQGLKKIHTLNDHNNT